MAAMVFFSSNALLFLQMNVVYKAVTKLLIFISSVQTPLFQNFLDLFKVFFLRTLDDDFCDEVGEKVSIW